MDPKNEYEDDEKNRIKKLEVRGGFMFQAAERDEGIGYNSDDTFRQPINQGGGYRKNSDEDLLLNQIYRGGARSHVQGS